MRILVTGAQGMLGSSLVPTLRRARHTVEATDINLIDQDAKYLDVRHYGQVLELSEKFGPELIVHLAAETDVDKCEADPDRAYLTNALGTQNVALACQNLQIPMVYISSAGVFDGLKETPYTEFDKPNPINVYGLSKLEGENYVKQLLDSYLIVRAGWMVGGKERDKKFVRKILSQIQQGADKIYAVTDKFGTPTYGPSFSSMLLRLINSRLYGLYHLACKGSGSRFDVARKILELIGRSDIELIPVKSEFFKQRYPASRPRSEVMRNYILDLRQMNDMPTWQEALAEYLDVMHADR